MESAGHEHLESLFKALTDALAEPRPSRGQEAQEIDWVIERIQDSFDSRAR